MPHRKYRALQHQCHLQAVLTTHQQAKEALQEMEREYKLMADWLELRDQADQQPHPKE